jgi:alpha-amylase
MRSLLRAILASALLTVVSCGSTTAYADRHRAVRVAPNNEWARGAVFYEIFVRSFYDSNGDGVGDFNGLISKLDYLNDGNPATTSDLGIDAVWLMPVFQSPSYHGYDTTDYETIERDYGSNADFQRFLDEAHKRGIRVIIDFVMNHTSDQHPWFIDSASSPTSLKRNWYVWSATNPGWTQPWGGDPSWHLRNNAYYYGVFWSGMPDLNYRTPAVKDEMFRLGRYWLSQGVDGYRLDATRYLIEDGPGAGQADTPETHQLLKDFSADVRIVRPDAVLVAENTVDTRTLATYFSDGAMNFNFPLASAIVDGVNSSNANRIRATLTDMISAYPPRVIDAPFLTNHDQTRIATVLGNSPGKLRNAAAILLTLPGALFIYYGEEVGLQNGPTSADESKRTPMPWNASGGFTTGTPWFGYAPGLTVNNVASQTNDPQSLLSYYRNWIAARKHSAALMKGDIAPIETSAQILAFTRNSNGERVLVVHNLSGAAATVTLNLNAAGFETVYADTGVVDPTGASGAWQVTLPARSSGAWLIR